MTDEQKNDLHAEKEHSAFLAKLLAELVGDGWDKLTIYEARKRRGKSSMLNDEIETLRIQLAGCGVAAMQNTEESIQSRITAESPGWSASYADVCRAVDREIALRQRVAELEKALKDVCENGLGYSEMVQIAKAALAKEGGDE